MIGDHRAKKSTFRIGYWLSAAPEAPQQHTDRVGFLPSAGVQDWRRGHRGRQLRRRCRCLVHGATSRRKGAESVRQ